MEIWKIIQIANAVVAAVALVLSVAACYVPSLVSVAMWAWTVTLWLFMFLVPMPTIERNKKRNKIALSLSMFVAVCIAIDVDAWLENYPATEGFSRSMLVYSVAYTLIALLLAGWLKLKEKKSNK